MSTALLQALMGRSKKPEEFPTWVLLIIVAIILILIGAVLITSA
jgi:cytochrome c biogenesis factor